MAQPISNTLVYKEDWAIRLQEELDELVKWKDICRVEYTNSRVLNNPYLTDITVQTLTRGSPYVFQVTTETNETITINTGRVAPQVIDRADWAQSHYMRQMELAERQGVLLNEEIEKVVYDDYTNWTVFDGDEIGGAAGTITVSITNIDDIITGLDKEIREANGESLANRNGKFIVWRPAHFQILQQYAMQNGYMTADTTLKNGIRQGFEYMGFTHYTSNFLNGGHVAAGVKKVLHLGICKDTYGQIMVNEKDPGEISGISVVSRVDFAVKTWNKVSTVLFDVRCDAA